MLPKKQRPKAQLKVTQPIGHPVPAPYTDLCLQLPHPNDLGQAWRA